MANDTKEKILDAALTMFAENGYAGTNVRELSASLGLTKSALYKHCESKEALWNALLDRMDGYYAEHLGAADHLPQIPADCEELLRLTMGMVDFTVHDRNVILVRKLLLSEQFRVDRVRSLATRHFLTDIETIYAEIFAAMMAQGTVNPDDAAMMGFAYTAPITVLIHEIDREPEKETEMMEKIEKYVRRFCVQAKVRGWEAFYEKEKS